MIYYRFRCDFECYSLNAARTHIVRTRYLIKDELLTAREFLKLTHDFPVPDNVVERIELSSRLTFWSFGARFACHGALGV